MTVGDAFHLLGTAFFIGLLLRVFAIYVVARIRLTDVFGYVTAAANLFTLVDYQWERFGSTAVIGWAGAVVIAAARTTSSVRARRRDPDHELLGVFLIGKRPHAVKNWIEMPARKARKA